MNAQFAHAYLGIGEVLVELRDEFPDISVSKIRFLESEGLIAPARSPSGYRRFGPTDVDQLRFILTAQRDQYLPLRVIRERLARRGQQAAARAGEQAAAARRMAGQQAPRTGQDRGELISSRNLMERAGIDDQQLAELEAHGLVRRTGRLYGQDAVQAAATVAALASYGVQARHLRTVRTAAEHQTSLIEQVVAPTLRQRSPQARDAAGRTAWEIAALLLSLHQSLIESALAEAGLQAGESSADARAQRDDGRPVPGQHEPGLGRRGIGGASA